MEKTALAREEAKDLLRGDEARVKLRENLILKTFRHF